MHQIRIVFAVLMLTSLVPRAQADGQIPNAHGNCAMPMTGFLKMMDINHDGKITKAQWMKMFEVMDTDKDGVIDDQEIAIFERNGMMMEQKMMLESQSRSLPVAPH